MVAVCISQFKLEDLGIGMDRPKMAGGWAIVPNKFKKSRKLIFFEHFKNDTFFVN
jgi:hypothetical protein